MTDAAARAQARLAALGDPQARARMLLDRMRAGELSEVRVRLAARLGDEAAREAARADGPVSLEELLLDLEIPPGVGALAAVVAMEVAMEGLWTLPTGIRHADAIASALVATRAWAVCPSEENVVRCERTVVTSLSGPALSMARAWLRWNPAVASLLPPPGDRERRDQLIGALARMVGQQSYGVNAGAEQLLTAWLAATGETSPHMPPPPYPPFEVIAWTALRHLLSAAIELRGEPALLAALRAELVPLLLE